MKTRIRLCVVLAVALQGCALAGTAGGREPAHGPGFRTAEAAIRAFPGRDLRFMLRDGRVEVLKAPVLEGDSVVGHWRRRGAGPERAAIARADIVRVEPAERIISPRTAENRRATRSAAIVFAFLVAVALLGTGVSLPWGSPGASAANEG